MFEINSQSFEEGDIVRFQHATLPENRDRDYQIIAATADGIDVSAHGFHYRYSRATVTRLGIIHSPANRDQEDR